MYKKNAFTQTFSETMTPKGHEKKSHQTLNLKSKLYESTDFPRIFELGHILKPERSGPSNSLLLVLESPKLYDHFSKHQLRNDDQLYKSTGRGFKVFILYKIAHT